MSVVTVFVNYKVSVEKLLKVQQQHKNSKNNPINRETLYNVSHGELTWYTIWNTTTVLMNCISAYACVYLSY